MNELEKRIQAVEERNKFYIFVPAVAFVLSTLTMPFFKKWWLARREK
ncbi:hypothetical protein M1506_02250 [Patescibacteria group bacterium]|nr:hypothetical protein [Patescibacteria group bacterium]